MHAAEQSQARFRIGINDLLNPGDGVAPAHRAPRSPRTPSPVGKLRPVTVWPSGGPAASSSAPSPRYQYSRPDYDDDDEDVPMSTSPIPWHDEPRPQWSEYNHAHHHQHYPRSPSPSSSSHVPTSPPSSLPPHREASHTLAPCFNCERRGFTCVPTFKGRATACTTCQSLKIKCSFSEAATAQAARAMTADMMMNPHHGSYAPPGDGENTIVRPSRWFPVREVWVLKRASQRCKNCSWRNYVCIPRDSRRGRACTKCYGMKIKCSYNDYEDQGPAPPGSVASYQAMAHAHQHGEEYDELESEDGDDDGQSQPLVPIVKRCKSCDWRGFECISSPKSRGNSCEKCRAMKIKCSFSDERGVSCQQCHKTKVKCMHMNPGPRPRISRSKPKKLLAAQAGGAPAAGGPAAGGS